MLAIFIKPGNTDFLKPDSKIPKPYGMPHLKIVYENENDKNFNDKTTNTTQQNSNNNNLNTPQKQQFNNQTNISPVKPNS